MKFLSKTLILSLLVWSVEIPLLQLTAVAATQTIQSPTIVNPQTQAKSQNDAKNENDDGSQQSSMLGMMAIAAGTAMMATGAAMMSSPPSASAGAALMAAGAALLAAGMAGMAAAAQMAKNAGTAGGYQNNLETITTSPVGGKDTPGKIKIDPSLLRDPKAEAIFSDLKNKTGLSVEDLAKGLNDGKSIGEMIAKKGGVSADKINAAIANASPLGSQEAMEKLGLTPEELAAMAKNASQGEDSYAQTGASDRKPASAANTNYDALFGAGSKDQTGAGTFASLDGTKVSQEVQEALDRKGLTGKSIFEMVHTQYKRKTPMMFGVQEGKSKSLTENPFANLKSGGLEI